MNDNNQIRFMELRCYDAWNGASILYNTREDVRWSLYNNLYY